MKNNKTKARSPWYWVPSLYYAEGIPYIIVMVVSVIMYKRMGISNTDIALYTSWLYLPWVIKPLWSPVVDILKTKRFWIIIMQLIIGAGLAGVAFTIPVPNFFQYTLAFLWLLAFSSATHDIAADGFYMLGLNEHDQAFYVGIRSTFYRGAMITGQGLLVVLAGYLEVATGLPPVSFELDVKPGAAATQFIHPDSLKMQRDQAELHFKMYPENPVMAVGTTDPAIADSLKAEVKNWNIKNGFYQEIKSAEDIKKEDKSWWTNAVVDPLEDIIRSLFGPEEVVKSSTETGNVAVLYFYLNKKPEPDEKPVFNFGWEDGDKSIALIEGMRFEFNENNWDKPALALIQIDPKLKTASSAEFEGRSGNIPLAWMITFIILAGLFILFFIYHRFMLPKPESDVSASTKGNSNPINEFFKTFASFFKKKHIGISIAFLLIYRLGESQLVKLASPFLLDSREVGGLGLTTGDVGIIYGTIGILALTLGGILGGVLASRHGLKYWIWWMLIAINLPNTVYVFLSYVMPDSYYLIATCVAIEQFGYGFGFTAYMLYMIYVSEGDHKTAHFAITTGFMALGMMIPGMISGWLQEIIGYQHFFIWVVIATIPAFIITYFVPIDSEFGKKTEK